ncbi:MAG TPA: AAA family ATPase [Longimicrobiales bacterium]|nr:AAA family ATPase [Longimicrobiales bacterium]
MSDFPDFPLTGRQAAREQLRGLLDRAAGGGRTGVGARAGRGAGGGLFVLAGESGTGKTRLASVAAEEARERGFTVATGRAYPMESGVPYALFADALLPLLRTRTPQALATLTRGSEAELGSVFPQLGGVEGRRAAEDPAEFRTRVFWTIAQLLTGLAEQAPLLLALDDLHAADPASLELLHFVARQTAGAPVAIVCTWNESEREAASALRELEQSLSPLGIARVHRVHALTARETGELLRSAFDVTWEELGDFPARLYDWTRGNVFFLQETLRTLVDRGLLRRDVGRWTGWNLRELELPPTVRDAVTARLDRLSGTARAVASHMAALGMRAEHGLLRELTATAVPDLLASLDELRAAGTITEAESDGRVVYDFAHPMIREVLYSELGLARSRALHGAIAAALQARHGGRADEHADELAYHYARSDVLGSSGDATRYLVLAGAAALRRFANREAANYLSLALSLLDAEAAAPDPERRRAMQLLARARQRLGEYDEAISLWRALLDDALAANDVIAAAQMRRGLALASYWGGRHEEALHVFREGTAAAKSAGDTALEARLRLGAANALHELGRGAEAIAEAEAVLELADTSGDDALLARAHRALLIFYTWTGPPDRARRHGAEAVRHARAAGEDDVVFSCHWALALLEGLTGRVSVMREHIDAAESMAAELRSPLFSLATAELSIEYFWSTGDWDRALGVGENAITLARSLNQAPVLTRILVWTAIIHLGRGDTERGGALIREAWALAAPGTATDRPVDVHAVVPAHIGMAAYHLHRGEFREAIAVGEAGLEIADRSGYVFWTIHRLLPMVTEAYCHLLDVEGALRCEARLRRDSERLGHILGLAWADTSRAIAQWLRGDVQSACSMLSEAATTLDSIPIVPEAARLRRQLAGRLADIGDRDGALRELRHVHEVFVHLGMEPELAKTRGQFRELEARPPTRASAEGPDGLTGREAEIARLVALRHSNKAIARALDISVRTVSTHLSNIFRKLGVSNRAELADHVRAGGLDDA